MTIPFRRHHDRRDPSALEITDDQLLDRLRGIDGATPADQARLTQGRVWERLVSEHPSLAQPARPYQRLAPAVRPLASGPARRGPTLIGRRSVGGWRAAMDVAAVAALVIGLVLGARGVGIMPQGSSPNPMMTQSVAAATATEATALDEAGTNRQPGPGPRVTPVLVTPEGRLPRIESALVLSDGIVYTLSSITADGFEIIGYDPATLRVVWSSELPGQAVDFAVRNSIVSVVTRHSDGRSSVINQRANSEEEPWSIDLPFTPLAVSSSADTILVSGHDESTGTPNAGEPSDISRVLAIDPFTQSVRWDIELTNPAGVEPLLTDGGIFYTTANGAAKAIENDSGEARWTTGTGGLRITSRAVAEGDLVYVVRPDGVVYALDRESGEERWGQGARSEDLGVPPLTTTVGGAELPVPAPILALSASGQLIVGYVWSNADLTDHLIQPIPVKPESLEITIVAFDAATGSRLWSDLAGTPYELAAERVEFGMTITGNQLLIRDSAFVSARSVDSGTPIWNVPMVGTISGGTIVIDHTVVVTRDAGLATLREATMPNVSTATPEAVATSS